ncbi:hypothetical protein GGD63_006261 [Bradyrhizobium sp. cir1]|nr:hypothetical protein [Bradyrhizobium sp. cir1]
MIQGFIFRAETSVSVGIATGRRCRNVGILAEAVPS